MRRQIAKTTAYRQGSCYGHSREWRQDAIPAVFFVADRGKTVRILKGGMRLNRDAGKIEWLRQRYPMGTRLCLDHMEGEPQMPAGLKGKVVCVDDIGQIHVKWENGSSLALNREVDRFHRESAPEKKRERGEPSR